MTVLPDLAITADAAILTLDDGAIALLRTPTQARQLGDLCRRAEQHLEQQQQDRQTRLDRAAADAMNQQNLPAHVQYGNTLAGWPAPPGGTVLIQACGCGRHERCPDCTPGSAW